MQTSFRELQRSATFKVATIGLLVLVLLIPLGMIEDTIVERAHTRDAAVAEIGQSWGNAQLIAGPVLILPYRA